MTKIVIVGGGTAGISTASYLLRKNSSLNISLIEPSDKHFYQPLWTLVGGGICDKSISVKPMKDVMPDKLLWIQDKVSAFKPDENKVVLEKNGDEIRYDFLIVAPGIQINWNQVEGLLETMGKNGVCSNYHFDYVDYTTKFIHELKSGKALFTYPNTPIKCGGAPQKIMYLAEEYFREHGVRNNIDVEFTSAGGAIFGVPKYRAALEKIIEERDIKTSFGLNLIKVDGSNKVATFMSNDGQEVEKEFSMLHAVPPMSAPDFVRNSPLANEAGWIDVDKFTCIHNKYKNVSSLGDASSLPTSKTGAAVRKEVPVLAENLLELIAGKEPTHKYNGYTSCPLITGKSKCIMAEFDYDGNPVESFPFDQAKERYSMYLLKRYGIPAMYWNAMLKGYPG